MTDSWHRQVVRGALALLLGVLIVGGVPVGAQEATPMASPAAVTAAHPAHIHEGTCDSLNPAPVQPLEDVRLPEAGSEAPAPRMADRHEVESSTTTVPVSLDDLLSTPFAINVHESAEQIDVSVACGGIAGVVRPPAAPRLY